MRQEIVIGVDGGASKTRAISQTLFGDTIGKGEAGEGNIHQNLEQAYQSVLEAINRSLAPINVELGDPKYQFHIGLGLAGSEVSVCKEAFLKKKLPSKSLIVESDAHVACMGAHAGHDGAVISIGTGVVGYQTYQRNVYRVGGWGFPYGDEGR